MSNDNQWDQFGSFTFRKMDEVCAREIIGWQYEPPYDIYNCSPNEVDDHIQWLLTPQYRYFSVWDDAEKLIGFCCFGEDARVPGGDYTADALDIGWGLKPDRTGQGFGVRFIEAIFDIARRHFSPLAFRVTVAAFNQRSVRVCEKVGFHPVQRFEKTDTHDQFIVLKRNPEQKLSN